jgi:hypothetical protein
MHCMLNLLVLHLTTSTCGLRCVVVPQNFAEDRTRYFELSLASIKSLLSLKFLGCLVVRLSGCQVLPIAEVAQVAKSLKLSGYQVVRVVKFFQSLKSLFSLNSLKSLKSLHNSCILYI